MKAVYMEKPGGIEIRDIGQRQPGRDEALLKIYAAGICGSDIGAFRGTNVLVSYPRVIGHELAGEIISIPENSKGLKAGDRVVVDPYLYCGTCYPCSIGRTNCCTSLRVLGVHVEGGMSETFAHDKEMLHLVPGDIPWELVPMAEPLSIALHGLHRLEVKAGEHLAIFGAGPIGLLAAMAAMHYGAEPIVTDIVEDRLAFARGLGVRHTVNLLREDPVKAVADITKGRLAECVMEASGANAAILSAMDVVSHAGRIALTGWPKEPTLIPTDRITRKEIDIRGARTSAGEFGEAVSLIQTGRVDVRKILSKVITLDEVPDTIRDIDKNPGAYLKVNVLIG